jgi:hypothetical protein
VAELSKARTVYTLLKQCEWVPVFILFVVLCVCRGLESG